MMNREPGSTVQVNGFIIRRGHREAYVTAALGPERLHSATQQLIPRPSALHPRRDTDLGHVTTVGRHQACQAYAQQLVGLGVGRKPGCGLKNCPQPG